jgi:hypothetical protein
MAACTRKAGHVPFHFDNMWIAGFTEGVKPLPYERRFSGIV